MSDDARKAAIALGICVICVVLLVETSIADRAQPNPASPVVWTVLAVEGAVALAEHLRFRARAQRRRRDGP